MLAIASKFLFYYSTLHTGQLYVLRTPNKLNLASLSSQILFLVDGMLIVDSFPHRFDAQLERLFTARASPRSPITKAAAPAATASADWERADYVARLCGLVVDKKLKTNSSPAMFISSLLSKNSSNNQLAAHYDLIIPNLEFKLLIRIPSLSKGGCASNDCNNDGNSSSGTQLITVYLDMRSAIFPLSVLPGMQISLFNLVRKKPLVYKCNQAAVSVLDCVQTFDMLQFKRRPPPPPSSTDKPRQQVATDRHSVHALLADASYIFDCFYSTDSLPPTKADLRETQIDQASFDRAYRLHLLFKHSGHTDNGVEHTNRPMAATIMRLVAQLIKIYELSVRVTCKRCERLASSCNCSPRCANVNKADKSALLEMSHLFRVQVRMKCLVDDHTSMLKISHVDADYQWRSGDIFRDIGDQLFLILVKYLNEIKLPSMPIASDVDALDAIRAQIRTNDGTPTTIDHNYKENHNSNATVALPDDDDDDNNNRFEQCVKVDVYKTLCEHVSSTLLDKYLVFHVDTSEPANVSALQQRIVRNHHQAPFELVKMSELAASQQYKSIFNLHSFQINSIQ